jgi:hypothetical protein
MPASRLAPDDSLPLIATIVVTASKWTPAEEALYQRYLTLYNYTSDQAAAEAEFTYQHDIRASVDFSRDDAIFNDMANPYEYAKHAGIGIANLAVKSYGGLRSLAALPNVDKAVAIQGRINQAQITDKSPFGDLVAQSLRPSLKQADSFLNKSIGPTATAAVEGTGLLAVDSLAIVGAGEGLGALARP